MRPLATGKDSAPLVSLSRGTSSATYAVIALQQPSMSAILRSTSELKGDVPLVVAQYLHPRTATALRQANIQHVDGAGNAILAFGDVYLHVEGKRPRVGQAAPTNLSTSHSSNVFSPRRAQVIFALVTWPQLADAPVRTVAKAAGTSVGIAQETVASLQNMGLEPHRESRAHHQLIDMWVAMYPEGLGRKLALRSFSGEPSLQKLDLAGTEAWLSGEQCAPGISGQETLTLYLNNFEPQLVMRNRWRQSSTPNIFLKRKFWHGPPEQDDASPVSLPPAPPLIVYADMVAQGDSRIHAAAQEYRERNPGLAAT